MNPQESETKPGAETFDFSAFPADTLFLDRRTLPGRSGFPPRTGDTPASTPTPRPHKERRRRVDPTTFEKQYTEDEIEFMNAVQDYKSRSGKMFPSHGDILKVALRLGYRKPAPVDVESATIDEVDRSTETIEIAATV